MWTAIVGLGTAALTAGSDSTGPGRWLPGPMRELLKKVAAKQGVPYENLAAIYLRCTPAEAAAFLGIPHAQVVEQARAEGSGVSPASYFPVTSSEVTEKNNTTLALVGLAAFFLLT